MAIVTYRHDYIRLSRSDSFEINHPHLEDSAGSAVDMDIADIADTAAPEVVYVTAPLAAAIFIMWGIPIEKYSS